MGKLEQLLMLKMFYLVYSFNFRELIPYCTTLFCISLMAMLGFVDDVLALKRRHKLWLPCLVSLAHVIVYFTCVGKTVTVVPQYLHWLLGKCINWGNLSAL